jgi:hypothetical protein
MTLFRTLGALLFLGLLAGPQLQGMPEGRALPQDPAAASAFPEAGLPTQAVKPGNSSVSLTFGIHFRRW